MKEKAFDDVEIIAFVMSMCILIGIIKLACMAINNVTQHPNAYLLVIAIAVVICIVQVQVEKQREIERALEKQREIIERELEKQREIIERELEKQRAIERALEKQRAIERALEKQREIIERELEKQRAIKRELEKQRAIKRELEKQSELARQKLLEKQREQELIIVTSFIIFLGTVIILLYKGICYLLTPNYNMLQQVNLHTQITQEVQERPRERLKKVYNNDYWIARVSELATGQEWQGGSYQNGHNRLDSDDFWTVRVTELATGHEWQGGSYRNGHNRLDSSVTESLRKTLERVERQALALNEVYTKRELISSCTSNSYLMNNFCLESFKPNLFSLEELNSKDYQIINESFSNKRFLYTYQIFKIKKLINENLLNKYYKQKQKYYNIYGNELQENYLFHGTTRSVLDSICTNNFDLKKVKNGLYGWGISFANNPYYASHYSTKYCKDENYVMILARVLVGKTQPGYEGQMYPGQGFDTTTNDDEQVLVKYDKDTFYPEFIVYFSRKR